MKQSAFTVFNNSGLILRRGYCQEKDVVHQAMFEGEKVIPHHSNDSTDYVKDGTVRTRPVMPLTRTETLISGIPLGAEIIVDGVSYGTCETGELTLEKEDASVYHVTIKLFPYLDYETVI